MTLAFLGPTSADRGPDLLRLAEAAVAGAPGFPLVTAGVGGFPGPHRARVAWLGFEPPAGPGRPGRAGSGPGSRRGGCPSTPNRSRPT